MTPRATCLSPDQCGLMMGGPCLCHTARASSPIHCELRFIPQRSLAWSDRGVAQHRALSPLQSTVVAMAGCGLRSRWIDNTANGKHDWCSIGWNDHEQPNPRLLLSGAWARGSRAGMVAVGA